MQNISNVNASDLKVVENTQPVIKKIGALRTKLESIDTTRIPQDSLDPVKDIFDELIELCKVLEKRKDDTQGFVDVVSDITYDPIFRINRIFEWEKRVIYLAWKNKEYKERLLNKENPEIVREALDELLEQGSLKLKVDRSINFVFHENTNNEIHLVIPQEETNHPRGY
jgi:hypothetical protein